MKTKRLFLVSVVALATFVASAAIADKDFRKERPRHSSHAKVTTTTRAGITTRQPMGVATRHFRSGERRVVVTRGARYYSSGYGYPYYSSGFSFNPFSLLFPYAYGYPYSPYSYGSYGYPYNYGYYNSYNRPAYGAYNSSVVVQVQTRLARAGYYHGAIDGVMGPRTHYAIRAYERDHGLPVDGAISQRLIGTMGLRY